MRWVLVVSVFAIFMGAQADADIVSDFEGATLEGWTGTGVVAMTRVTAGGNPGGFLRASDNVPDPTIMTISAPAKFLGDLSIYDEKGFMFDAIRFAGNADRAGFGTVTISSGATSYSTDMAAAGSPQIFTWSTYSAPLTWSVWGAPNAAAWQSHLTSVTSITIEIEYDTVDGNDTVGIDNVTITPEPSTLLLLGVGALGLSGYAWRRKRRRNAA